MPIVTRHSVITVVVLAIGALLATGIFIWSGVYNIAADDAHTKPVYSMLQMLRDRSITARANELHPPPNLNEAALIRQGAGNYDAMCTSCHLGPDMEETEISKGLYPAPPNFSEMEVGDPAHHFWVIKHGIKASGMPAWGKSMEDKYIWGIVAFMQQLPKLDGEQYLALVASSGGHSHGGGETAPHGHGEAMVDDHAGMPGMPADEAKPHSHPPSTPPHHDAPQASAPKPAATSSESKPHTHAPGTPPHDDAAPAKPVATQPPSDQTPPEPAPADQDVRDNHDHQH